jgi:hypothetical protein
MRAVALHPTRTVAAITLLAAVCAVVGAVAVWQHTGDPVAGFAPAVFGLSVLAAAVTCYRTIRRRRTSGPGAVPDTLGALATLDRIGIGVVVIASVTGAGVLVVGRTGSGAALLAIAVMTACLVLLQRTERALTLP